MTAKGDLLNSCWLLVRTLYLILNNFLTTAENGRSGALELGLGRTRQAVSDIRIRGPADFRDVRDNRGGIPV